MAIVACALFVIGWGTNVATPFLVLYRDRLQLGANATQLIFVIYVAGILMTLLIAGQLSDRFGRRAVLVPSLALGACASLVLIFGRDSYGALMAGRVMLGVVSGASLGVGAAWLQELAGREHATRTALITTIATYGGFGIGPVVSLIWELTLPHPLVLPFVVHIVLSLGAIPIVRTVPETVNVSAGIRDFSAQELSANDSGPAHDGPWRPRLRLGIPADATPAFTWIIVPVGFWVFAFPSTAFALFPVLVTDAVDVNEVLIPAIAGTITAWSAIIARPAIARIGVRSALTAGVVLGSVGYLTGIIAWQTGVWPLLAIAAFMLGGASGVLSTACLAVIADLSDDTSRGAMTSTFYLVAYAGMSMPLIVTGFGSLIGTTTMLAIITVVSSAVAATRTFRHGRARWSAEPVT